MLDASAMDKDTYEVRDRAKAAIVRVARANPEYDEFDSPLDEEDRERARLATVPGEVHKDLGPPQVETTPLEDAPNPFPMLAPPVEF